MRFQNSNVEMYNACLCVCARVYECIAEGRRAEGQV